jgi:hypothetical protein
MVAIEDGARADDSEVQPIAHAGPRGVSELLAWRR